MKILIIGGDGTIGRKVKARLALNHDVITAGRNSGDVQVDFSNSDSIREMFESLGKLDAIIAIAGEAKWDKFENLTEDDFYIGIKSKLMGQVNAVRIGKDYLNDDGSITLSTGILADDPVDMTSSAAMVNGAIHSFVRAVALELPRNIRINAVCSDLVEDSYEKYKVYFPGNTPVPMSKIVDGYVKCVEGKINGRIIRIMA
ncbi:MAG: short chain dehydrogenase [Flavobacteriaceae bacterium]|nr:short chain dehydrogenase [Bacteroidia bacterium]MBT8287220.1 short chain dehydrogenase [Bacteroidia bacterium]NNF75578.1 short chain dehydrogenase [Flavobacteriaceae bacterium]NNK73597.1 short chain dehydrogenase [Flavobacteriaceae bacterium]